MSNLPLILASSSPTRAEIIKQIYLKVDEIRPANIDETEFAGEKPKDAAFRLAKEKCLKIANQTENGFVIAADSVCATGRTSLPKAETDELVRYCLNKISGRKHHLYTGLTISKVVNGEILQTVSKVITTEIKVKRMTPFEIEQYVKSGEGINKAGGYQIHGFIQAFITSIKGLHSNVAGLPLHNLYNILIGLGYKLDSNNIK